MLFSYLAFNVRVQIERKKQLGEKKRELEKDWKRGDPEILKAMRATSQGRGCSTAVEAKPHNQDIMGSNTT